MKRCNLMLGFFVVIFCLLGLDYNEEAWQQVTGITETNLREIAVDPYRKGVIYARGEKTLSRSEDNGNSWQAVFSMQGDDNVINFIGISKDDGVFICTQKGLFRSKDGRLNWGRVFKAVGDEENNTSHIVFSEDGRIFLGTKDGLFLSSDKGITWKRVTGEAGHLNIRWVEILDSSFFIAAESGLYKNSGEGWKRTFVTVSEDAEYDTDATDETIQAVKPINSIAINKGNIFLATDSGIFISEDKGDTWKRFIQAGLISLHINRLLFKDDFLYAATDKGVFVLEGEDKLWCDLYKGVNTKEIRSIAICPLEKNIWIATKKGLYRAILKDAINFTEHNDPLEDKKMDILRSFDNEPNIRDVQKVAIEYAEVHPDKIKKWREAAKKKALLPNVSLGLDRNSTDLWHWDSGGSTTKINDDILVRGRDTIDWDISLSWDLGDCIWNSDQTTIDTRSKLMVQLREDIMDEVTRTYFERRRLQIEMRISPPKDLQARIEKELRLQELTADVDAMTGGYFSNELKQGN